MCVLLTFLSLCVYGLSHRNRTKEGVLRNICVLKRHVDGRPTCTKYPFFVPVWPRASVPSFEHSWIWLSFPGPCFWFCSFWIFLGWTGSSVFISSVSSPAFLSVTLLWLTNHWSEPPQPALSASWSNYFPGVFETNWDNWKFTLTWFQINSNQKFKLDGV